MEIAATLGKHHSPWLWIHPQLANVTDAVLVAGGAQRGMFASEWEPTPTMATPVSTHLVGPSSLCSDWWHRTTGRTFTSRCGNFAGIKYPKIKLHTLGLYWILAKVANGERTLFILHFFSGFMIIQSSLCYCLHSSIHTHFHTEGRITIRDWGIIETTKRLCKHFWGSGFCSRTLWGVQCMMITAHEGCWEVERPVNPLTWSCTDFMLI